VRMLWGGLYLTLILSGLGRLGAQRTLGAMGLATVAVVAGNALRSTALFFTETGVVKLPAWSHEGVGVAAFVLVGLTILEMTRHLEGSTCNASAS